jgi:hypothetical protein
MSLLDKEVQKFPPNLRTRQHDGNSILNENKSRSRQSGTDGFN